MSKFNAYGKGYNDADKGRAPDPCKKKDSWADKVFGTGSSKGERARQHNDYNAGYSARANQGKKK